MVNRPFCIPISFGVACIGLAWYASWVVIPEWTLLNKGLFGLAIVVCVMNFYNECLGKFQLSYSKFAPPGDAHPRVAWALSYAAPAALYAALWVYSGKPSTFYHLLALGMYLGHFAKRVLECMFLHNYSKRSLISTSVEVSMFYCLGAVVQHYWCNMYTDAATGKTLGANQKLALIGLLIFDLGELINLVHHIGLANLRADGATGYKIPQGFLFRWIVCPHYFGELIAWFGMAVAGQHLCLYMAWLTMVVYLSGRSHHTRLWYLNKIDDFPEDRYKLFPLIF